MRSKEVNTYSSEPKSIRITIRFTKQEMELLGSAAKKMGLNKSRYISKMALEGKIIDTYSPAQKALVLKLINISNNLNQLAKVAHTAGILPIVTEIDSLLVHIRKIINSGR